jgi:D-glycero-alpha-D-manno-heptose-7-phosphate kinase
MSLVGVHEPLEIGVVSDLPSGTGMGGSGALSAALLVGLHSFVRRGGGGTSGEEVHRLESQVCESVGQQDGCAAAYGGFNHMEFHTDGTGTIHSIHAEAIADLERHCLLCYTGQQRDAGPILEEQARIGPDSDQFELLRQMAAQVRIMRGLLEAGRIQSFADGVSVGWYAKSCLARGITNPNIDAWYETALRNGAWGAKICGAGGGGFMLLIAPPEKHRDILEALQRPQTVPVKFNTEGAKVIFDDRA